jgi:RNA polymerase sigma factor (sigma-70 family)
MLNHVIQREISWFYPWLRRVTQSLMTYECRSHTLQPTALANEVLAKLLAWRGSLSGNAELSLRQLAVTIARQTLIDHGRQRVIRAAYRKEMVNQQRMQMQKLENISLQNRLAAVVDAMEELESIDPTLSSLIRYRFFQGYSLQKTAELLDLPPRTAARRWAFAKAFLADAISSLESREKTSDA